MGRTVAETVLGHPFGLDQQMVGHGEIAVEAVAHGHAVHRRLHHVAETPYRDASPATVVAALGREELPVADDVAGHAVGDVVGRQGEVVHLQQHLTRPRRRARLGDYAGRGEIVALDLDFKLFFAVLANAVVTGTSQALQIYMNTYFWGFGGEQLRWMAFSVAGGLVAFFTVVPLQNLLDKKYLLVVSSIAIIVVSMVPVSLKLLGLAPPAGSSGLVLMVLIATAFVVYFVTIAIIMIASMVADTLDLQELNTGNRQEGLFNSVVTFSSKATSGIGLLMAGLLIDFVILLPEGARASEVTEDMTFRLAVLDAYVVPLFNVVWMWLALRYGITRARYAQIRSALDEKRSGTASGRRQQL